METCRNEAESRTKARAKITIMIAQYISMLGCGDSDKSQCPGGLIVQEVLSGSNASREPPLTLLRYTQ